jgi:copper chaperone CopZ
VAIGKLPGVESVTVSLKRASADIRLRPGNAISIAQLRKLIKDNGFSTREIAVTAVGTLADRNGAPALIISGLDLAVPLARDAKQPQAYDDAVARLKGKQRLSVEISGVMPVARDGDDRIVVGAVRDQSG